MSRTDQIADDLVLAVSVAPDDIPLIDFQPFLEGSDRDRAHVADQIREACERIGFFNLKGVGFPPSLRGDIFAASAQFYHQPLEDRARVAATPEWYRGWIPQPPQEPGAHRSRLFEQYRIHHEAGPVEGVDEHLNGLYSQPNRWPEDAPKFRAACTAYFDAMLGLARSLMQAFSLGLGLPADRLDGYFTHPMCQLTLLYYLPLPGGAEIQLSNTVAHTDDGPFTILAQDDVGGLEVRRRDGAWIAVPPIPDSYTINVGDMLMWLSNGRYLSNFHRVKNRAGCERFSVPFFMNPDRDAVIAPLPELVLPGAEPAYPPVHAGRHMARFYPAAKSGG
ncbi:2OG-Fe(II) oxygenase family protein [Iodidimonas sp. SYSU 1G8]|uniref:isopenicillin N synthase family dioxygenase n=1 Tax=Iodidimonas sp. SYSU 1G8 TaxID=3133967 RepID=UPI0031FE71A1